MNDDDDEFDDGLEDGGSVDTEISDPQGTLLGSAKRAQAASAPKVSRPRRIVTAAAGASAGQKKAEVGVGQQAASSDSGGATAAETQTPAVDSSANGKAAPHTATWTREAEVMWGEMLGTEHPKSLSNQGKTAYDVQICIYQLDGAQMARSSPQVHSFPAETVVGNGAQTPGDALINKIIDEVHMPISPTGPRSYEVRFVWKATSAYYGRGTLSLPAPNEITARRMAQQRSAYQQGAESMPQPPPPYQQPYQPPQQAYVPQVPPQPPPPQQGVAGAPPGYYQPPNTEVSNLRAELGELRGMLLEVVSAGREGRRPQAMPQAPPVDPSQQPQGFGASHGGYVPSQRPGWPQRPPRTEIDDVRDEVADLRDDLRDLTDTIRRGLGGAPPAATAASRPATAAPPQPASQPVVVGRSPQPVWVEGVGWCVPAASGLGFAPLAGTAPAPAPATPPAPPPAPAPAPPPVQHQQPIAGPVLAGAGFGGIFDQAMGRIQQRMVKNFEKVASEQIETMFSGFGAEPEEPAPSTAVQAPAAEEKVDLPFEVIDIPHTTLFGHQAKYTPNKKTGRIDFEGAIASNPGLVEKGAELIGVGMEALAAFAKKAATGAGTPAAGVGGTPPQQLPPAQQPQPPATPHVVSDIPTGARDAQAGTPQPSVPGNSGWPTL